MKKILVVEPTFRVYDVEQIKVRPELRISGATDDRVIEDMLLGAVEAYEDYTNNILAESTWDFYFDAFPANSEDIELPGPLKSVTSISYLDESGNLQTLGATAYKAVLSSNPQYSSLTLKNGQSWPLTSSEKDSVIVRAIVGYSNANAIPQRIKDGLLLKIQETYYGTDLSSPYQACWKPYKRVVI